ncbi:hypothetical protein [Corynebacterium efficiens YS-314]|uniref:Uncharacterized protein n=2 Tax=Corynebacterium efficiens TaxID=152794 RepID=Q8FQ56_COREF|nr:hypothetical protein [Corynebacterium efficiens YS-314]
MIPTTPKEPTTMKLSKTTISIVAAATMIVATVAAPVASAVQVRVNGDTCNITSTEREGKTIRTAVANAAEKDLLAQTPSASRQIKDYFASYRAAVNDPSNTNLARAQLYSLRLMGAGLTQEQLGIAMYLGVDSITSGDVTDQIGRVEAATLRELGVAVFWLATVDPEVYPETTRVAGSINETLDDAFQACADGENADFALQVQADLDAGTGSSGSSMLSLGSS